MKQLTSRNRKIQFATEITCNCLQWLSILKLIEIAVDVKRIGCLDCSTFIFSFKCYSRYPVDHLEVKKSQKSEIKKLMQRSKFPVYQQASSMVFFGKGELLHWCMKPIKLSLKHLTFSRNWKAWPSNYYAVLTIGCYNTVSLWNSRLSHKNCFFCQTVTDHIKVLQKV